MLLKRILIDGPFEKLVNKVNDVFKVTFYNPFLGIVYFYLFIPRTERERER